MKNLEKQKKKKKSGQEKQNTKQKQNERKKERKKGERKKWYTPNPPHFYEWFFSCSYLFIIMLSIWCIFL